MPLICSFSHLISCRRQLLALHQNCNRPNYSDGATIFLVFCYHAIAMVVLVRMCIMRLFELIQAQFAAFPFVHRTTNVSSNDILSAFRHGHFSHSADIRHWRQIVATLGGQKRRSVRMIHTSRFSNSNKNGLHQ